MVFYKCVIWMIRWICINIVILILCYLAIFNGVFFRFIRFFNLYRYYFMIFHKLWMFFFKVNKYVSLLQISFYNCHKWYTSDNYVGPTILVKFVAIIPCWLFNGVYSLFIGVFFLIKKILISLLISFFLALFLFDFFKLFSFKYFSIYFSVFFVFFWLVSSFNFFLRRYRFGKFTAAIQRFWKRSFVYFWLVEGFLFFLFFYFFLNSSQECTYFYDESSINKLFLLSLINVYISCILILLLIFLLYFLLININNLSFFQELLLIFLSILVFVYVYLVETYQFYFIITLFTPSNLEFDDDLNVWVLVSTIDVVRVKKQYFLVILLLKYWHFLFIFCSFIFFICKSYEQRKLSYQLLSFNLQNLFILLFLTICLNFQWVKWVFWRFFQTSYFWFFSRPNLYALFDIISEWVWFFFNIFY
jgi:hypothetical protein